MVPRVRHILSVVLLCLSFTGRAQYLQFTQYNFTAQRVNPAMVGTSDFASAGYIYRNQSVGGDLALHSNYMEAAYPIMTRKGKKWSGIGMSLMDDRYGIGGIYNLQEAALSYALQVRIGRRQLLSLGFKGLYHQRRVDINGFYSYQQYVDGQGFDRHSFHGEEYLNLRAGYFTFSSGLYWQSTDRQGRPASYLGLSFYDFNRPDESFFGVNDRLHSTFVAHGGLRIQSNPRYYFTPEVLYTYNAGNHVANIGTVLSYVPGPRPTTSTDRVDIILKYVPLRTGILGIQWHKENLVFGLSYDYPFIVKNAGNTGAMELSIVLKQLVDKEFKRKRSANKKSRYARNRDKYVAKTKKENQSAVITKTARPGPVVPPTPTDTLGPVEKDLAPVSTVALSDAIASKGPEDISQRLSEKLQEKQDSLLASARAGTPLHQPLVLEKVNLRFNFEHNSANLDQESYLYVSDLAQALKDNPDLRVELTGHTDNTGTAIYNIRLSRFRAESIKKVLVDEGVEPQRILTDGKGYEEPLNKNSTEEEKALNRRVELLILYDY